LKGTILSIGIVLATIFKIFKQNLFAIFICVIIIALYYLTSFDPNFTEYQ
jgi:type IV secretory pathway VirB3-like protein